MATNDFLPFANGGGANVLTQAQYAALTALLSGGYQSGVANSAQMNKTWRQSSIMAAVLGQFAADYSGNNSVDDGTIATLEANLVAAIRSATKTGVILADTGAANAYTAVNSPPLVAGIWVDGVVQQVKIAHANTGASTYAPDGLTAIPIYGLGLQPLQGGELALNGTAVLMRLTIAGVNSGNPIAVLMECAGGAQQIAPATQSQHALQAGQAQGLYLGTQTITSSQTYTPGTYTVGGRSVTATKARFRGVAAGGGGGGSSTTGAGQNSAGAGGNAGNPFDFWVVTGLASMSITVGAPGTGTAGANGNAGGDLVIGSIATIKGGAGGGQGGVVGSFPTFNGLGGVANSASTIASAGGMTLAGILNGRGQQGLTSILLAAGSSQAGVGGYSAFGTTAYGTSGVIAGYGIGGNGAVSGASSSGIAGATGGLPILIIDEYA